MGQKLYTKINHLQKHARKPFWNGLEKRKGEVSAPEFMTQRKIASPVGHQGMGDSITIRLLSHQVFHCLDCLCGARVRAASDEHVTFPLRQSFLCLLYSGLGVLEQAGGACGVRMFVKSDHTQEEPDCVPFLLGSVNPVPTHQYNTGPAPQTSIGNRYGEERTEVV
jgi:hypothetical protein